MTFRRNRKKYWFDDGNIVLNAGDTLFRVHSSIFARHSEVFKDMFSIPQPSKQAETEMIDGCPVISLTDATYDIENVISIFYDNQIDKFRGQLSIVTVRSMLRLGNKYAITHLEEEALFRLHHDYPQDLTTWDALLNKVIQPLIESDDAEDAACVIAIAHQFQLNTILPAAYSMYLFRRPLMRNIISDDWLTKRVKERCLVGYTKMLKYLKDKNVDALCPPFFLPAKSCVGHCKNRKWNAIKGLPIWEASLGILDSSDQGEPIIAADLCSHCKFEVRKFTEKIRQDFWVRLPTFYGLPSWENLKDG